MNEQISLFDLPKLEINKPIRLIELPIGDGMTVAIDAEGGIYTLPHEKVRSNGRKDNRKGKKITPSIDKCGVDNRKYGEVVL